MKIIGQPVRPAGARVMRSLAFCLLLILPPVTAHAQIAGRHVYEPVGSSNPFLGDSRLPGPGIGRELHDVRRNIHRARDQGMISGREARQLRREARAIEQAASVYAADGLSPSEQNELETRTRILSDALNKPR
jgi:hypothetical protein